MGEANRKMDHAVREVLKRTSPDVEVEAVVRMVSADLNRPVHESTIRNSLLRMQLRP